MHLCTEHWVISCYACRKRDTFRAQQAVLTEIFAILPISDSEFDIKIKILILFPTIAVKQVKYNVFNALYRFFSLKEEFLVPPRGFSHPQRKIPSAKLINHN